MFLNKEQILAAQDRRYTEVDVPEWGGKVRLASLDADQLLKHEKLVKSRHAGEAMVNPLSAMLASSIVDENGKLIFDEKDMDALGKKSPAVITRLAKSVKELNKLDEEEDEVEGNSVASPSEG